MGLREALGRGWHAFEPSMDVRVGVIVAAVVLIVEAVPVAVDEAFAQFLNVCPFRALLDCKALPDMSWECLEVCLCSKVAVMERRLCWYW